MISTFLKKTNSQKDYPGLFACATELVRFIDAGDVFIILLADGRIIHFKPNNSEGFRLWLGNHNITDLTRRHKPWNYGYLHDLLTKLCN